MSAINVLIIMINSECLLLTMMTLSKSSINLLQVASQVLFVRYQNFSDRVGKCLFYIFVNDLRCLMCYVILLLGDDLWSVFESLLLSWADKRKLRIKKRCQVGGVIRRFLGPSLDLVAEVISLRNPHRKINAVIFTRCTWMIF